MKRLIIAICTLALAGCGEPETLDEALGNAAHYFNKNATALQTAALKDTKLSASVTDEVLTIRMANFPSGTRTFDPNAARKLFREKLCDLNSSRNILDMGGKIRVELRSNYGKDLPPVQVARC